MACPARPASLALALHAVGATLAAVKRVTWLRRLQANFVAGLAVVLPVVLSVWLFVWLFGTVANFTDKLLFFLPRHFTRSQGGAGPVLWYWSLLAFAVAVLLIAGIGRLTRLYVGRRLVEGFDALLRRVPLFNKIYSTIKQVNDAITSDKKTAFKQAVLLEYPRAGCYSLGFITSEQQGEAQAKTGQRLLGVFVPTTPNPTSGFIVLVPESQVLRLDMPVAEGIKFVMTLGSVPPEYRPQTAPVPATAAASPGA